jgi:multidrug efflux pump subunit AcrB
VVLLLGGIMSYSKLGQDEDPPFTFRAMVIRAYWPGSSSVQMAEQVTDKLEKKLQETPFVDKIRSYSKPGETLIILELRESTPPKEVQQVWYQVRKKIGDMRSTLPAGVMGPQFNDEFGDTYGSIFALSTDGFTYAEVKDYADFVRQQLLAVPTVSKVELYGMQDEKLYIEFSSKKFGQLGIPFEAVVAQINAQNAVEGSGVLVTPTDNLQVRVSGALMTPKDLEMLPLHANGNTFRLGDFAKVTRAYQDPPRDKMRYNGKEVIGLGISMEKGGDIIQLGRYLDAAAATIKAKLPVGIELERVADQPRAVSSSPSKPMSSTRPESTAERGLLTAPMATRPARPDTSACNSPTGSASSRPCSCVSRRARGCCATRPSRRGSTRSSPPSHRPTGWRCCSSPSTS